MATPPPGMIPLVPQTRTPGTQLLPGQLAIGCCRTSEAPPLTAEISGSAGASLRVSSSWPSKESVALGGYNDAYRDSGGAAGRAFGAGHRVPGPHLPERVRSHPAVQRAGGRVHDPAPGQADPVSRADGAHRDAVPQV